MALNKVSIELIESEEWIRAKVTVEDEVSSATITVAAINKLSVVNDPEVMTHWRAFLEGHVKRLFGDIILTAIDGIPEVTKES